MFIKGKGFYLALPLLVVVLAKMLHPILYVFLIFYFKKERGAGLSPCAPYKWVTAG